MDKKWKYAFLATMFVWVNFTQGLLGFVCYASPKKIKTLPIRVAENELEVELATAAEELMLGLMYRDTLGDDEGMLFVFPREQNLSFWMKNTRIPLSIAFIKEDGRIIQIESMKPFSLDSHTSKEKAKYALEMRDGWFTAHKVRVGDFVRIPIVADKEE